MQNYFYEYEASYHTVAWGRTVKGGELWWNVHAMYKNKINGNIRKETDIRKIREAVKEEKQKITPYFFSQNVAASEICGVIWRSPNARILYETHRRKNRRSLPTFSARMWLPVRFVELYEDLQMQEFYMRHTQMPSSIQVCTNVRLLKVRRYLWLPAVRWNVRQWGRDKDWNFYCP